MHENKQEFVNPEFEKNKDDLYRQKGLSEPEIIEVGETFNFAGRKFRVRKITKKDIICRPVDWEDVKEEVK